MTFKTAASETGLKYQWFFKSSAKAGWRPVQAESGKTAAYTLTAQARHNGYQYRCRITNAAGSTYTKTVTLTVK